MQSVEDKSDETENHMSLPPRYLLCDGVRVVLEHCQRVRNV